MNGDQGSSLRSVFSTACPPSRAVLSNLIDAPHSARRPDARRQRRPSPAHFPPVDSRDPAKSGAPAGADFAESAKPCSAGLIPAPGGEGSASRPLRPPRPHSAPGAAGGRAGWPAPASAPAKVALCPRTASGPLCTARPDYPAAPAPNETSARRPRGPGRGQRPHRAGCLAAPAVGQRPRGGRPRACAGSCPTLARRIAQREATLLISSGCRGHSPAAIARCIRARAS